MNCTREFVNNKPMMIIVANKINDLVFDEIPKILNFSKTEFTLIGCTLYQNNHFISKVLIQNTCHVVDNLSNTHPLSFFNNSCNFWRITNLFYQYKN